MVDQEADVNDTPVAGSASTEANLKAFRYTLQLANDRPEYLTNQKRVGEKLAQVFKDYPDLYRAISYLAQDTQFAIVFASHEQRKIITL